MKKVALLFAVLFLFGITAISQDLTQTPEKQDEEVKTLFAKGKDYNITVGYFIGPEFSYTRFKESEYCKNTDVFLMGLSMGVTLNHWFSIGLQGHGIINSGHLEYENMILDSTMSSVRNANLWGGYGGLLVQFTAFPKSMVHVTFPILIGGGGLTLNEWTDNDYYYYYDKWDGTSIDWDAFFVIQPGVQCEINVVKFFRIGIGASYRYTPDLDLMYNPEDLINQFNANVSLKFGKF